MYVDAWGKGQVTNVTACDLLAMRFSLNVTYTLRDENLQGTPAYHECNLGTNSLFTCTSSQTVVEVHIVNIQLQ
jgi:hypothetical protein